MNRSDSKGFTLTEIMISVVIAIMVFSAMGVLLSRCFSLWVEAQAQWKLAQHARVTRTRLLYGGFGIGTGLLNATNVTVQPYGSWEQITFNPVTESGQFGIYGRPDTSQQNIWIEDDAGQWAYAQSVSLHGMSDQPLVMANHFDATVSNDIVTIAYTLNFSAMGRNFELPQYIEVRLVNE